MDIFNFSGNIILQKGNTKFQSLYGSQSYGTFFSIFGSFDVEVDDKKELVSIKSLKLRIINYKGLLNIEFDRYEISEIPFPKGFSDKINYEKQDLKLKVIQLKIYTKASTVNISEDELCIKQEDLNKLQVNKGDLFLVNRELLSIYGETQKEVDNRRHPNSQSDGLLYNPIRGGVFDTEFYFRNGKHLEKRKDGDFVFTNETTVVDDLFEEFLNPKDGNPSCRMRGSQIYIL